MPPSYPLPNFFPNILFRKKNYKKGWQIPASPNKFLNCYIKCIFQYRDLGSNFLDISYIPKHKINPRKRRCQTKSELLHINRNRKTNVIKYMTLIQFKY